MTSLAVSSFVFLCQVSVHLKQGTEGERGIERERGEEGEIKKRALASFFQMSAGLGSKKSTPVLPQPCLSPMYTTPWPRLQVAIETRPSGGD